MAEYFELTPQSLLEFYTKAVLPQFGIYGTSISWGSMQELGPDEFAYYFNIDSINYCLIFEDFGGLAQSREYIEEVLGLGNEEFEYINPTSHTEQAPSFSGFKMQAPYQYVPKITGSFTLLKIQPQILTRY